MTNSFSKIARTVMAVIILAVLLAAPQTVTSSSRLLQGEGPRQRGGDLPPTEPAAGSLTAGSSGKTDQIIVRLSAVGARMTSASVDAAAAPVMQPALLGAMRQAAGVSLAQARYLGDDTYVLKLSEKVNIQDSWKTGKRMEALAEVLYAEPDLPVHAMGITPNDPYYPWQWHYFTPTADNYGINAPDAWGITQGKSSVTVAVIDSGIHSHSEFTGRLVQGYDFVSNDSNPNVDACANANAWHGTHVAGTIGANSNNGTGVAGINWFAKIQPVRVLDCTGNGVGSDIIAGMKWAAGIPIPGVMVNPSPAKVLNLSLGGSAYDGFCPMWMQDAINVVVAKDVTVVVAAGNNNNFANYTYPANCQNVITVAATAKDGSRATYSNYGTLVDISAPGGDGFYEVYSTYGNPLYAYSSGTSMAAPHVSGVVSLMYGLIPDLTHSQVESILKNTTTNFPTVFSDQCTTSNCGAGILNALKAVQSTASFTKPASVVIDKDASLEKTVFLNHSSWLSTSTNFGSVLCTAIDCNLDYSKNYARCGGAWAWFGGTSSSTETGSLEQSVVIPKGKVQLEFYLWIQQADAGSGSDDWLKVSVDGMQVFYIDATAIGQYSSGYTLISIPLNEATYGNGLSHKIQFDSTTKNQVVNFFVDDIYLISGEPQVYLPQVMR